MRRAGCRRGHAPFGSHWGLFLFIGVPLGFMATLGPLAYAGIYIEPLRQFWRPWPPDIMMGLAGIAGFAATLGYLAYRKGPEPGQGVRP